MVAVLFAISFLYCVPVLAGIIGPSPAPELDPGSLTVMTSVATGAYLVYSFYRRKIRTKN